MAGPHAVVIGHIVAELQGQLVAVAGELAAQAGADHAVVAPLADGQVAGEGLSRVSRPVLPRGVRLAVDGQVETAEAGLAADAQRVAHIVIDRTLAGHALEIELRLALGLAVEIGLPAMLVVDLIGRIAAVVEIAGRRQLGSVVAHAAAEAAPPGIADRQARRAGPPGALGLLGDQIDDPARAVGAKLGRRIGDDLHPVDAVGGHLLQRLTPALALEQARGLAVDQDRHRRIAAQADIALHVDLHRREIAQGVGDRARLGRQVARDAVAAPVDRGADLWRVGLDLDRADARGGLRGRLLGRGGLKGRGRGGGRSLSGGERRPDEADMHLKFPLKSR